jgi:hypothetical protein
LKHLKEGAGAEGRAADYLECVHGAAESDAEFFSDAAWQSCKDASLLDDLAARLKVLKPNLIVLEATGGLETVISGPRRGRPACCGRQPGAGPRPPIMSMI